MIAGYISSKEMAQRDANMAKLANQLYRQNVSRVEAEMKIRSGDAVGMAHDRDTGLWLAVVERQTDVPRTGRAILAP